MDDNRRQFHDESNLQSQFQTTRTRQPRHDQYQSTRYQKRHELRHDHRKRPITRIKNR